MAERGGLLGADLSLLLAIDRAHLHIVVTHQCARRLPRGHEGAARGAPRRIALDEPDRISHQPPLPLPLAQRRHELGALEEVRIEGELVGAPARLHGMHMRLQPLMPVVTAWIRRAAACRA